MTWTPAHLPRPFARKLVVACRRYVTVDETQRGQFGEERYEKAEFQRTVRATFLALMEEDKVCGSIEGPSLSC